MFRLYRSVTALLLAMSAMPAVAATFTINSTASLDDANLNDGVCDVDLGSAGQQCTLRAAIQAANATPAADTILFASSITTLTLTLPIPQSTTPMAIDGANASAVGGRVNINGNNVVGSFDFNAGAQGSTLKNLVIRNFNDDGVAIVGHGYTIENNYIGVTPQGTAASRNTGDGISVTGVAAPPANIPNLGLPSDLTNIATVTADLIAAFSSIPPNYIQNNVISGNDGDGIDIFSENAAVNIVSNNRIGSSASGLNAIPNGTGGGTGHGVRINSFSYANVIGPGNQISGNNSDPDSHGVALIAGAVRYPNFISGNIIGPSSAIVTGLGNSVHGIFVDTRPQTAAPPNNPTNLGALIGPGNIIGYNGDAAPGADLNGPVDAGIAISGNSARIRVYGNFIGVGEDPVNQGTFVDIGNRGDGITVNTADHEIGGTLPVLKNVISSNDRHGISVRGSGVHSLRIVGNLIGRDPLDQVFQPNGQDGIRIFESSGVQIGGSAAGEGNTIAGNARHGVKLGSTSSGSSNLISANSIYANGDLGIDLDRIVDDPDPIPDPLGPDPNTIYANFGQNQPEVCNGNNIPGCVLPSYALATGATTFGWRLQSAPNTPYAIEVYASISPDPSGSGEGQRFLGSFTTTTNAQAVASGTQSITPAMPFDTRGRYISLTARATNTIDPPGPVASGPANNSSEFSNAVRIPSPGSLQFSLGAYSVNENAGSISIEVQRVGGSDGVVSVQYATANGSAIQPGDYAATSGGLFWPNGDIAPKSFTVNIVNDAIDENDETLSLILLSPGGGATVGNPSNVNLSIIDDDLPPVISIADLSLAEGQSGTTAFNFTVSLSAASERQVSFRATSADGSATVSNNDYQALGPTLFAIDPGQISRQVTVNVVGDTTPEANETFLVNLGTPFNTTIGDGQAVGTIVDDDSAASSVNVSDASTVEGTGSNSTLLFTLMRTSGVGSAAVTVQTADVLATLADNDYVQIPPTVINFLNGETSKQVAVTVIGDAKFEGNETLQLNLSNPVNLSLGDASGSGLITNDDSQPSISIRNVSLYEGQSGTTAFNFAVRLSNPSVQAISVSASTANGSATVANNDYQQLLNVPVNFLPGETEKMLTVQVVGDTSFESDETFFVNLSAPSNATVDDGQGMALVVNDDGVILANGFE